MEPRGLSFVCLMFQKLVQYCDNLDPMLLYFFFSNLQMHEQSFQTSIININRGDFPAFFSPLFVFVCLFRGLYG